MLMKRRPGALPDVRPCQRSGCSKLGKPRTQSRRASRKLHLCDECFERLPAHQLNDLFLFTGEQR